MRSHQKMHPFPFFQKKFPIQNFLYPPFCANTFSGNGIFSFQPTDGFFPLVSMFFFFLKKKISAVTAVPLEKKSLKRLFFVLACSKKKSINQSIKTLTNNRKLGNVRQQVLNVIIVVHRDWIRFRGGKWYRVLFSICEFFYNENGNGTNMTFMSIW